MSTAKTNVLIIGGGGREHALAWAIAKSPRLGKLYCAPGNAGTASLARNVDLDARDHAAVVAFVEANAIDLTVVGPEAPLVDGLADALSAAGARVFGPSRAAASLEASKGFTKDLCARAGIPTAAYRRFHDATAALAYVRERGAPIVVKADGLAAGKGVTVAATLEQAEAAIAACFSGAFGAAGAEVVVEEMLVGEEVSFFVLADGETALALASAQDHKRAFDGDEGPNTGGMGAYSPAPVMTEALAERTMTEIIHPTLEALAADGTPFRGVLFAGLMITADGPKLIEYNVRFGDPECQVLMARLASDALELLDAVASGRLAGLEPQWRPEPAVCIVMAARGYPGSHEKGTEIRGLVEAARIEGVEILHAGTRRDGVRTIANGGRVLGVTALGATVAEARERAYRAVDLIDWPEGFCRRDIAWRAISRSAGRQG
ncbi:MAG: phosphoribosylamine--glycine ligase [Rhizobiales bacterium]|nr:phosphoribosylamine--glycine ligase [Hyphomicrobiales bacterium]